MLLSDEMDVMNGFERTKEEIQLCGEGGEGSLPGIDQELTKYCYGKKVSDQKAERENILLVI